MSGDRFGLVLGSIWSADRLAFSSEKELIRTSSSSCSTVCVTLFLNRLQNARHKAQKIYILTEDDS